ncbi:DoxX family protein [Winogradskyella psychrotolerans]|uniref:DoxX family protein n=1 Tax=Winogradskyella psychrotolerans TaxID=1344585 RepID=UPI001C065652|nr:DoxX family protein [Winogradskyella psychrotolerans]MBU2921949.1 DoxX family protein [Winogradskyella psychrotolerans]
MKTIYWISTGIISAFLLLSSYSYLFSKSTIDGIKALGFPDYFRIELAVLKSIAAIILVLPFVSSQLKEWTYAGVGFFLVTALVAHVKHKDSIFIMLLLFVLMGILIVSNIYMHKYLK